MLSTESCSCRVVLAANLATNPGDIFYVFAEGSQRHFPEDVTALMITMPVQWKQVYPMDKGLDDDTKNQFVSISWAVKHPENDKNNVKNQWQLSGFFDKPTLSPSMDWKDIWHGYLTNGELKSC